MAVIDSFSFVSCVTTRGEYLDYQNGGSGDLGFIFTPVRVVLSIYSIYEFSVNWNRRKLTDRRELGDGVDYSQERGGNG